MIVLFALIYFVCRPFYHLAFEYNKHQWGYSILAAVVFFTGTNLGAFFIGIVYLLASGGTLDDMNETVLALICVPFGLLAAWGFYKILENSWSKKALGQSTESENVLDANLMDNQNQ